MDVQLSHHPHLYWQSMEFRTSIHHRYVFNCFNINFFYDVDAYSVKEIIKQSGSMMNRNLTSSANNVCAISLLIH